MNVMVQKIDQVPLRAMIHSLNLTIREEEIMHQCCMISTKVWSGVVDGEVIAIWGVVPPTLLSSQAYLWLYHTEKIKDHQFVFIRRSQIAIKELLEEFDTIIGHVLVGNDDSIRWLKWLGARFLEPDGMKIPFVIRKK